MAAATNYKANLLFSERRQLALDHAAAHPKGLISAHSHHHERPYRSNVGIPDGSKLDLKAHFRFVSSIVPPIDRKAAERYVERLTVA